LSSLIRFWQEFRSNKAAETLKGMIKTTATVLRQEGLRISNKKCMKSKKMGKSTGFGCQSDYRGFRVLGSSGVVHNHIIVL
ncbi:MAG: hypothetical protein ACHQM6_09305, partial [Candidatus Kapaibacterium sp.]